MIPAVLVDYMERYAFEYGLKKMVPQIVKRNKNPKLPKKIPMKELFHMITGTSSGAILAATLTIKDD